MFEIKEKVRILIKCAFRKMFSWINQILVGPTIECGYYTDKQIFAWPNKIFWLIKLGWLYQLSWLIQPNTMFVIMLLCYYVIMNIFIKNSNNNILLKKRQRKDFWAVPKSHSSIRLGLNLRPSSFLHSEKCLVESNKFWLIQP